MGKIQRQPMPTSTDRRRNNTRRCSLMKQTNALGKVNLALVSLLFIVLLNGCSCKTKSKKEPLPYPKVKEAMSCQELATSFEQCISIIDNYNN